MASMAASVGGGKGAKPGEISLAHNGVLFMDEFPEFPRAVLETLRQPIETGEIVVARANAHIRYPCKFLLIAAANPCKCGYMSDPARACAKVPLCGEDYLGRISGPLMAVNSDDDLINPPQLRILEREITRVAKGRAVVLPISDETRGHGTHSIPAVWKQYLSELLEHSSR